MNRLINRKVLCQVLFGTMILLILSANRAEAVPSFARQTGMSCTVCHTIWPQLTHFGRVFKLDGYTLSIKSHSRQYPVAAMVQSSYTTIDKNSGILKNGVSPFDDTEDLSADRFNVAQQVSAFYAGRICAHLGTFSQLTYDGTANVIALDNTDIRYSKTLLAGGKHLVIGITINNSPTVEDVWNSTPSYGFPFASPAIAPAPTAATIIDGTLGQQVGGIGAYASWADFIYGAAAVYRTTNDGITKLLGAGADPDTITEGAVPYWRMVLFRQCHQHSFEIGAYGIQADIYPAGNNSGPTDTYTDYAFDGQYQFILNPHLFTLRTTWIHEDQNWDASFNLQKTSHPSDTLETFKINAGYGFRSRWGAVGGYAGYFSTTGDRDPILYPPDPVDGSRTGKPDSRGFILQGLWVFKEKYQLAIQYTIYDKFNGAVDNYDGSGRDASDNNTLYVLGWFMF